MAQKRKPRNWRPFGIITAKGEIVSYGDLYKGREQARKSRAIVSQRFSRAWGLVSPPYDPYQLCLKLEESTWHARAMKAKARDVAGGGWDLVPQVDNPSQAEHDALSEFLSACPLPINTVLEKAHADFEALGYGAVEVVREDFRWDGVPTEVNHLPAWTLRIHRDRKKAMQQRQLEKVWFRMAGAGSDARGVFEEGLDIDKDTGEEAEPNALEFNQRASEILMWHNYCPGQEFYGLPDHVPALKTIDADSARRNFNAAFFDHFGIPAYAVYVTGDFQVSQKFEDAIKEHFEEVKDKPHSTLVLMVPTVDGGEVKVMFEKLAADAQEASFITYGDKNRDEILSSHGVPPYRAGVVVAGQLAGGVAAETDLIYKQNIIYPRQRQVESLVNRYIVPSFTEDWEWKLREVDIRQEMQELEMFEMLVKRGAALPSEMRDYFADRFGLKADVTLPVEDTREALEAALESFKMQYGLALRK